MADGIDIEQLSEDQFKEYLQARYLSLDIDNQTAKEVFERAWDYGHSYGYSEVEGYYMDLAELVNNAHKRASGKE